MDIMTGVRVALFLASASVVLLGVAVDYWRRRCQLAHSRCDSLERRVRRLERMEFGLVNPEGDDGD
jgi:hypothetical protein